MAAAKRTSDDEGRIFYGGELPDDDGSLDDVVVDPPQGANSIPAPPKKEPDELWTGYFLRRLSYEGIELGEFEKELDDTFISLYITLNSGICLELRRYIDSSNIAVVMGSKDSGASINLRDLIFNDEISLDHEQNQSHQLTFRFFYFNDTTTTAFDDAPPEFRQLPLIRNYQDNKVYSAEQIITDLVEYIKETGIKR